MFRRLWEKIRLLWKLAKSERATPSEIGWAVAIGAFAGCTPAIGVHGPLAMGLATLARKNRLFAWLGSRISNMMMLPFIALAEVQISHRLRTGAYLELTLDNALDQAPNLLLDWCLGTFPVGGAVGLVMGLTTWAFAHRRDARKRRALASSPLADSARAPTHDTPAPTHATPAHATPARDASIRVASATTAEPAERIAADGAAAEGVETSATPRTPAGLQPPSSGSPA